ncbi:MAG: hypothetical protein K9L98_02750 [Candidatus Pacebacteria bacterium]|nr:hypothetical protein [Candidatus Paceibacterota bacterium]MCF7862904.1 hypothetical protein [Candidatus Paceibacterota bacterium]
MTSETKNCQNCKNDFMIESEDFLFYQKIKVPPPTFCPECRMVRRMNFRNERNLYHKRCDLCNKKFVTNYYQETLFKVYCHDCWWGDRWDPLFYAKEYNFSNPFFEQFYELFKKVPLIPADTKGKQLNSEYGNYNGNVKDCYMCFSVIESQDSLYCSNSSGLHNCFDSDWLQDSELCSNSLDSYHNNECSYLQQVKEGIHSKFIFKSSNINQCFMSSNLINASNFFYNKQLSVKEYNSLINKMDFGSYVVNEKLKKDFYSMKNSVPHKYAEIRNSLNSKGNNIVNSKNVKKSFDVTSSENVAYSMRVLKGCKDVYDVHGVANGELVYESVGCGFSPNTNLFTFSIDVSHNLTYSMMCKSCSNLFACIGLRNKQYCILNKQYTKEEYEDLVPKIIKHMNDMPYIDSKGRVYKYGEFFPSELSPFAYNETIAQEFFPLIKEQAKEQGYEWKDKEERNYTIDIKTEDIPDNIKDLDDFIINKVIECQHKDCNHQCTEAFKIIPEELQFYKRMNLPLPRLCPNCRHYERLSKRNPMKLWHRSCMCDKDKHGHVGKCTEEFETSYAPDRPEIVYCEGCYNKEVY